MLEAKDDQNFCFPVPMGKMVAKIVTRRQIALNLGLGWYRNCLIVESFGLICAVPLLLQMISISDLFIDTVNQ